MQKLYNIKKTLPLLLSLASTFFGTSMYSMEAQEVQPEIQVFITHVKNTTDKDWIIKIDDTEFTIQTGETKYINQEVTLTATKGDFIYFANHRVEVVDPQTSEALLRLGFIRQKHKYLPQYTLKFYLEEGKETKALTSECDFSHLFHKPIEMQKFTEKMETISKGFFRPKIIYKYEVALTLEGENLGQSDISVQIQRISGYEHKETM